MPLPLYGNKYWKDCIGMKLGVPCPAGLEALLLDMFVIRSCLRESYNAGCGGRVAGGVIFVLLVAFGVACYCIPAGLFE
jgi:hypothetical protein